MAKYRKKPVVVEAFRFCVDEMPLWFMNGIYDQKYYIKFEETYIRTLEGDMRVNKGDYIIKGIQDEFYPCKPDIFEATYEAVTSDE